MNQYYSNETVEAIQVAWIQGSDVSEEAATSKNNDRPPKKAEILNLGNTFVSLHNVKVGDYVIYRHGSPSQVVDEVTFEADYTRLVNEEEAEETLAS